MSRKRLFLWSHFLTVATNDDTNVLEAAFTLTDEKLIQWSRFEAPISVADDDHIELLRLRSPAHLREQWDEAGLWDEVSRLGMPLHLVDHYVDLAITEPLTERELYPEDVDIFPIGSSTDQAMRIIEHSMPTVYARLEKQPLTTSHLVSSARFFLPSIFTDEDEKFMEKQVRCRAAEIVDADIDTFALLMNRIPNDDHPARIQSRGRRSAAL